MTSSRRALRLPRRLHVAIASSALTLASWCANAQDGNVARQHYQAGAAMLRAGNCTGAIPEFRVSLEQVDSPNTRLLYARCLAETGDVVAAVSEYERTERDATTRAVTETRFAPTRDAAHTERAAYEARIGRVVVRFDNASPPSRIVVAGHEVPPAAAAAGTPVMPGTVSIAITSTAGANRSIETNVQAGARVEVDGTPPVETRAVAVAPPVIAPINAPPPHNESPIPSWLPYTLAGVGAAGLIASLGFYLGANNEYQTNLHACGNMCSDQQIASGRAFEEISYVALGVGAAFVAGGVITWVMRRRTPPPVYGSVGPTSVSVTVRF